ncbi:hypothetical protein [Pseudonocardia sp. ICBG601]|uniref:hypothetical protein n=1 Tax=Pseudonocardia sp. ICBG601 TaxID=2846759 RepID=UPI001CF6D0D5|nr:hypothetical protein [Pseudonocardia sp. ICBG601]
MAPPPSSRARRPTTTTLTFVPATSAKWFPTGVHVGRGGTVSITATGRIRIQNSAREFGPEGDGGRADGRSMVASLPSVALLGMISPEVPRYPLAPDAPPRPAFLVGPAVQHTATEDGELYLIVNDNVDFHHDNTGSFTVTVDVRSPGIPAKTDLERGREYTSPSGAYALRFQDDGNLVLSRRPDGTPVWALQRVLGDRWSGHSRVEFDGDGHLVVHDASGAPVWTSPGAARPTALLSVTDDGRIVISDNGTTLWSSS